MSSEKFSLCLIVRNCADILDRCLRSAQPMKPDEIVVVNTGVATEEGYDETTAAANRYGARVFDFPWDDDFSAARNFAFSKCSHETVMWLDSDDEVANPVEFAKGIRAFARHEATTLGVQYLYEFAGEPNQSACTTELMRERVVKKSKHHWKSPIHEVLCCETTPQALALPREQGYVFQHLTKGRDPEGLRAKLERNLQCFNRHWPDGDCESRMIFYWGNTLLGLGDRDGALKMYQRYMAQPDTHPGERHVVLCSSAEVLRHLGRHEQAMMAADMAISQQPNWPSGWLQKSEALFMMNRLEDAVRASEMCEACFSHHTEEMVCNTAALKTRPFFMKAFSAMKAPQGADIEKAKYWCSKALDASPEDKNNLSLRNAIQEASDKSTMASHFFKVCSHLRRVDPETAEKVAQYAPEVIRYQPEMQCFWQVPVIDGLKVAIVCGDAGLPEFDDESLIKGISGSEEAVVHVSSQLVERGYTVDIYNNRKMGREVEGGKIRYIPYPCWKPDHPYDLIIYWRAPDLATDFAHHGGAVKMLWLHDVLDPKQRGVDYCKMFHRVIVLSEFHRKVCGLEGVPNVVVSRNGIDVENMPEPANDPDKVIWPSDPSRGLLTLLAMWPKMREVRPNLTMKVLYGFSVKYEEHAQSRAAQGDRSMIEHKEAILAAVEASEGVEMLGMVPQAECHQLMAEAGWWLYPTQFPEISCITAMKAQALGCRIIATKDFALPETVKHGYLVEQGEGFGERFCDAVLTALKEPEQPPSEEAIQWSKGLGWKSVVDSWLGLVEEIRAERKEALSRI